MSGPVHPGAWEKLNVSIEVSAASTPLRLEKKHPLAVRWCHWINFPVLMVMIWSGLLIYWANDVYRIGWGEHTLFKFFPQAFYERLKLEFRLGEGVAWHFNFAYLFALNGIAYVLYMAVSGEWRHIVPGRSTLREALHVLLHDLRIRRDAPPRRRFNGAQKIAYTSIILMGAGSVITGVAIYKPTQFAWLCTLLGGYQAARLEHFWLTIGYCAFFGVHIAMVVKSGWNNFRAMITGFELAPASDAAEH